MTGWDAVRDHLLTWLATLNVPVFDGPPVVGSAETLPRFIAVGADDPAGELVLDYESRPLTVETGTVSVWMVAQSGSPAFPALRADVKAWLVALHDHLHADVTAGVLRQGSEIHAGPAQFRQTQTDRGAVFEAVVRVTYTALY